MSPSSNATASSLPSSRGPSCQSLPWILPVPANAPILKRPTSKLCSSNWWKATTPAPWYAASCLSIPGLGETVAFDVTHLYASVKENNPRAYVKERYHKDQQPAGDPDCRLGVKRSTNKEQADGSTKEEKEYLWGYGSGVASATVPGYGDVVLAEYTLPFNENDITYFVPLYIRTVATLGFFPTHITADAAFDAWYTYQMVVYRHGIAAIPLNQHGHPESQRDRDGVPLCAKELRSSPVPQRERLCQGLELGIGRADARDLGSRRSALQGHLLPAHQYRTHQQPE